jgi:ABC-type transport system substrate-binding protein
LILIFLVFAIIQILQFGKTTDSNKATVEYVPYPDTLHFLGSDNLTALSPYEAIFADDVFLINQVYQGLVKLDNHMLEIPELAEFWEVDSAHLQYTFFLKKDQYFHNGEIVTADDVIGSLEYFLKNKSDSYIRPYFKVIKGAEDFWQGKNTHVEGIKKESPFVVSFFLKHPYIPFLKLLSLPEAKIMPVSILRKKGISLNDYPIGSGSYFIKDKSKSSILLEAFNWEERKSRSVNVKYFQIWLDEKEIVDRVNKNNFDISYSYVRSIIDSTDQFEIFQTPSLSLTFMGINYQKYPTSNKNIRKALFYGINQDEVREEFGSIASPVNFYCPLNLPRDMESINILRYDYNKAKTFLNAAVRQLNSDLIPKMNVAVDSTLYSNVITNVILKNLDSLGIPYNVNYYSDLSLEKEAELLSNNNLFVFGWYMDVPDPEFFFDVLFNSTQPMNLIRYSNNLVDSLLNTSYSNKHLDDRLRAYVKIEKILMDDVPIVPLLNDYEEIIYRKSLNNVMFNRIGIVGLDLSKIQINVETHHNILAQIKNAKKRS